MNIERTFRDPAGILHGVDSDGRGYEIVKSEYGYWCIQDELGDFRGKFLSETTAEVVLRQGYFR